MFKWASRKNRTDFESDHGLMLALLALLLFLASVSSIGFSSWKLIESNSELKSLKETLTAQHSRPQPENDSTASGETSTDSNESYETSRTAYKPDD